MCSGALFDTRSQAAVATGKLQSHASTFVRTLKIPNMAAITVLCIHLKIMYTVAGLGGAAPVAALALATFPGAHFLQGITEVLKIV